MDDTPDAHEVDQQRRRGPKPDSSDYVLRALVKTADEESGFAMGVTIAHSGGFVTGTLVGAGTWANAGLNDPQSASMAGVYRALVEDFENGGQPDSDYLHLRDAFIVAGANVLPHQPPGFYWRARLSEISGWSSGSLGLTPSH